MRKGKFARTAVAAIVIAALATLSLPTSQADNIVDEQIGRLAPPTTDAGWIGADVDDSNTMIFPSIMYAGTAPQVLAGGGQICTSVTSGPCADKSNIATFNMYLPQCTSDTQADCIESLQAINPDGSVSQGALKSYFPAETSPSFVGDPDQGVPNGWNPSLWNFPGVSHAGGNDFLVAAQVLTFDAPMTKLDDHLELEVAIYPVSEKPTQDSYYAPFNSSSTRTGWQINNDACPLFLGDHQCATAWPFPSGVKFQATIRTSGPISGWVHGRLDQPNISYSSFGTNGTRVQVTAGSEVVPVFASWQKFATLPSDFQDFLLSLSDPQKGKLYAPGGNWQNYWDGTGVAPYTKLSVEHDLDNYDDVNFKEFQYFLGLSNNTAIANKSQWAFYTGFTGNRSSDG